MHLADRCKLNYAVFIYQLSKVGILNCCVNGDGLCTMIIHSKDKLENYKWWKIDNAVSGYSLAGQGIGYRSEGHWFLPVGCHISNPFCFFTMCTWSICTVQYLSSRASKCYIIDTSISTQLLVLAHAVRIWLSIVKVSTAQKWQVFVSQLRKSTDHLYNAQ